MTLKIILASASPRRRELLSVAGVDFEVHTSDVEEQVPEGASPEETVKLLAGQKASAVAERFGDCCVIGADTVVVCDGKILGKPRDRAQAYDMLRMLSGKTHCVFTGVCIICRGKTVSFAEKTEVTFYDLTDDEINAYIATGEPMDKAGAYGIQGRGCVLIKGILGDYFNVVGLPVAETVRAINKLTKNN
ncbi:MAG: Maf family protein [Clostridiales bacterium]|nr:Maf family protein [Clostridiales bacterium]